MSRASKAKPKRELSESQHDQLWQAMEDWRSSVRATLMRIREITCEFLEELQDRNSPLHDFVDDNSRLKELLEHLDDCDCTMMNVLIYYPPKHAECSMANPLDLLRQEGE